MSPENDPGLDPAIAAILQDHDDERAELRKRVAANNLRAHDASDELDLAVTLFVQATEALKRAGDVLVEVGIFPTELKIVEAVTTTNAKQAAALGTAIKRLRTFPRDWAP